MSQPRNLHRFQQVKETDMKVCCSYCCSSSGVNDAQLPQFLGYLTSNQPLNIQNVYAFSILIYLT